MTIKETIEKQLSAAINALRSSSGIPTDQARYDVAALAVIAHEAEILDANDLNMLCQYVNLSPKKVKYVVRLGAEANSRAFECIGGGLYIEVHPITKAVISYGKCYTLEELDQLSTLKESIFTVKPTSILKHEPN